MSPNQQPLRAVYPLTGMVMTGTTEIGFTAMVQDLTAFIESLGTDGTQVQVRKIKIYLRVSCEDELTWLIQPVIVQTNGSWSTNDNQADHRVDEILADNIDDEFGFQFLGDPICPRVDMSGTSADPLETHNGNRTIDIPRHIINLLNKEVNTERLQNMEFGVVGWHRENTGSLRIEGFITCDFILRTKGITIR